MVGSRLESALTAVGWDELVAEFLSDPALRDTVEAANLRVAVWAKQLESAERNLPAISFVREMQSAGHHVAMFTALALYKPAASAMRTMLEAAMYFSYFRSHSVELATLVRDPKFYIDKRELIDYHKQHTADFATLEQNFGLLGRLHTWYSFTSSIVHGQIPGEWARHIAVSQTKHDKGLLPLVVKTFTDGEAILHDFFLCTVGRELWSSFSPSSKKRLLSGLTGDQRTALALDEA